MEREKKHIDGTIIVEGKNDIKAIKAAVEANIITTSGLGLNGKIKSQIIGAAKLGEIIIMTDSDYAGEKIRKKIDELLKGNCKHAYIPREDSTKDGDIGIENAKADAIISALKKARIGTKNIKNNFTQIDLINYGLTGEKGSAEKRAKSGKKLGIGYCNSKQFLSRLNHFGITREELEESLK